MNRAEFLTQGITSNGGPLLLLSEPLLPFWEGIDPPSNGREVEAEFRWAEFDDPDAPATDYDRACDVIERVDVLDVGQGQVLVFPEKLTTAALLLPGEKGLLLVRAYGFDTDALLARIHALTEDDWLREPFTFHFERGPLFLFDSASPGAEVGIGAYRVLDLTPGTYAVETGEDSTGESVFQVVHRLVPVAVS